MTATGLRHNIATNSRNAKHIPTDDMAERMGHTLHIHKTKHRYPLQVVLKGQIGAHLFELGGISMTDDNQLNLDQSSNVINEVDAANLETFQEDHS